MKQHFTTLGMSLLTVVVLAATAAGQPSVGWLSRQPATSGTEGSPSIAKAAPAGPAGKQPQIGTLNFPTFSKEDEKNIRGLKRGEWIPVKIDREYLILHGGGIRLERGPYYVQLLADTTGEVTKILVAKEQGTNLDQVDINAAEARDGSFATVLNVVASGLMPEVAPENNAFTSSSGESGSIWIHLKGRMEIRAELMGLASRHPGLTILRDGPNQ
ncbi:MAG TPA: hypothetical protein VJX67_23035 [Blastocatellia bacterium]|nr:hypothetical protein [Blastocatellia bacterium]